MKKHSAKIGREPSTTEAPAEIAACASLDDFIAFSNDYIQRSPTKALAIALGLGFVLRMAPIRLAVSAFIRIVLALIKPVALGYVCVKVYEAFSAKNARKVE